MRKESGDPARSVAYSGAPRMLDIPGRVVGIHLSTVTELGRECSLAGSPWLETLILPKRVVELRAGFCRHCRSLKRVNTGECSKLRWTRAFCFQGCVSLLALDLPGSVEGMRPRALSGSGVEEVRLRDAFRLRFVDCVMCKRLSRVELPATYRPIDLVGCSPLAQVTGGVPFGKGCHRLVEADWALLDMLLLALRGLRHVMARRAARQATYLITQLDDTGNWFPGYLMLMPAEWQEIREGIRTDMQLSPPR